MEVVRVLLLLLLAAYIAGSNWWAIQRQLKKEFNEEEDLQQLTLIGRLFLLPGHLLLKYVTFVEKAGKKLFLKDSASEPAEEG